SMSGRIEGEVAERALGGGGRREQPIMSATTKATAERFGDTIRNSACQLALGRVEMGLPRTLEHVTGERLGPFRRLAAAAQCIPRPGSPPAARFPAAGSGSC